MRQILLLFTLTCSVFVFAHKTDSVGTKVRKGKVYIVHKVEQGQGLYSISRKYGVSLKDLVAENPGSDKVIKTDHFIYVPTNQKPVLEEKVVTDYFQGSGKTEIKNKPKEVKEIKKSTEEVSTFAKYHVVKPGETLYSISRLYNTSVEMITTLNGISGTNLSDGQRLMVQDGKATSKTVTNVDKDFEEMKDKVDEEKYKDLGFDTKVEKATNTSPSGYSISVEKLAEYNIEKVEEKGTATINEKDLPANKNFAYHFNAPIGTVILVSNLENTKSVFVKIVGNFEKKEESSEIIKITPQTAEEIDFTSKSRVLLSYAR